MLKDKEKKAAYDATLSPPIASRRGKADRRDEDYSEAIKETLSRLKTTDQCAQETERYAARFRRAWDEDYSEALKATLSRLKKKKPASTPPKQSQPKEAPVETAGQRRRRIVLAAVDPQFLATLDTSPLIRRCLECNNNNLEPRNNLDPRCEHCNADRDGNGGSVNPV